MIGDFPTGVREIFHAEIIVELSGVSAICSYLSQKRVYGSLFCFSDCSSVLETLGPSNI